MEIRDFLCIYLPMIVIYLVCSFPNPTRTQDPCDAFKNPQSTGLPDLINFKVPGSSCISCADYRNYNLQSLMYSGDEITKCLNAKTTSEGLSKTHFQDDTFWFPASSFTSTAITLTNECSICISTISVGFGACLARRRKRSVSACSVSIHGPGQVDIEIEIALTGLNAGPVNVLVVSSDGTAIAGLDYEAVDTVVTFPPSTSLGDEYVVKTIVVRILENNEFEGIEYFYLTLSVPDATAAVNEPAQLSVVILNDGKPCKDFKPKGPPCMDCTAHGSVYSVNPLLYKYDHNEIKACYKDHYGYPSTFDISSSNPVFTKSSYTDVAISNPTCPYCITTIGVNVKCPNIKRKRQAVNNNDNQCTSPEGTCTSIEIEKTGLNSVPIKTRIDSSDATAVAGLDYMPVNTNVTFPASSSEDDAYMVATVIFCTIDDDVMEGDEYFYLTLSVPDGTALINGLSQLEIVIEDNDSLRDYDRVSVIELTIIEPFVADLFNPLSDIYRNTASALISAIRPIFASYVTGFNSVRVRSFRPGSIVAELEIILNPNSESGGDEVLQALRQNISPTGEIADSDLVVDPNSIQIIAELCPVNYCLNDGVCESDVDNRRSMCRCVDEFSGIRCEERTGGTSKTIVIAVPFAMALLLIIVLFAAMCFLRRIRQRRPTITNEPVVRNRYGRSVVTSTPQTQVFYVR
ncbi:uncharacterized protein [Amphiura filiformis]|uniref:uncharacterized protein n=1 Tax=Amphiura filiformis TaxID=82378 RepID=UPI003B219863